MFLRALTTLLFFIQSFKDGGSILGLLIIESQFKRKKATLIPKENFCISRWMCEGILTDCPCQQKVVFTWVSHCTAAALQSLSTGKEQKVFKLQEMG